MNTKILKSVPVIISFMLSINICAEEDLLKQIKRLQKTVDDQARQITVLIDVKKQLNDMKDSLQNKYGEINAQNIRLKKKIDTLNGVAEKELNPQQKMARSLKIVIPRYNLKAKPATLFQKLEALALRMDPDSIGIKINYEPSSESKQHIQHFDFESMPVGEIIKYLCLANRLSYTIGTKSITVE